MKIETIIEKINSAKLPSVHHVDEVAFPDGTEMQRVARGIDVRKHRWYEITTDVYKVGDRYLGVRGASQIFNESDSWEDLCVHCVAFEMEQVQTTTYVRLFHERDRGNQ